MPRTNVGSKLPANAPKLATPKTGRMEQFKSWGDSIDNDFANFPDAVSNFLTKRVGAPAPTTSASEPVGPTLTAPIAPSAPEPDTGGGSRDLRGIVSFPTSGVGTTLAGGADRTKSSRIIILAMGVAGAAIIIGGQSIPSYQVGNTKVPGNMRAFAGVVIAGTVALVLNEISPTVGMMFGVSLIFVAVADVKAFTSLGNAIFGPATHSPNPSGNAPLLPPGTLLPPTTPGGPRLPVNPSAPPGSPQNPYNMGSVG